MTNAPGSTSVFRDALADWGTHGCPVCGSRRVEDFFDVPAVPTDAGAFFRSEAEARRAPTGRMCLALCRACGYIGNRAFDDAKISYGAQYEISLHHSPVYASFLEQTAARLVSTYGLRGRPVLEIACGSGHFLETLGRAGASRGFGVDPSVPRIGTERQGGIEITLIRDMYGPAYADLDVALVCCRQTFHSLADPMGFLRLVRSAIGGRADTVVYVEVPNADYVYRGGVKWNFFFEAASQFRTTSLSTAFLNAGFSVIDCQPCYEGDQYLYVEARIAPEARRHGEAVVTAPDEFVARVESFAARFRETEADWRRRLQALEGAGKKVAAWGAGGRAGIFLSILGVTTTIPYVVDVNPRRWDGFLPVTGQRIVPPDFLRSYRPDTIIVTNPTYTQEIREQVAAMGLESEILSI
jgi:SAM-dependent methyltransferase